MGVGVVTFKSIFPLSLTLNAIIADVSSSTNARNRWQELMPEPQDHLVGYDPLPLSPSFHVRVSMCAHKWPPMHGSR